VALGLALAIFASRSSVDWPLGTALGAGNLAGAQVGVGIAALKGHAWIKHVVTVAVILVAIRLWFL
jgi:uncharacterized membrane protein YfcA